MLDPSDKQNVPKAVSLLQNLANISSLPSSGNPASSNRRESIDFIAEFMGYFLNPFINVTQSLSEQVQSLVTYAHLAARLQMWHGTSCLTGALYADSQAVIKNIIITIARMQNINPNLCLWLIHEGTDRLEGLFCDARTQDHARNFDIEQLCGKLSVAALINAAFQRNPDLDKGHRHLNLKGAMGIDRVNPRSWIGDVRVGNIDLAKEWESGRRAANTALARFFPGEGPVDFDTLFPAPGHDLLRPLGDYIGVKSVPDDQRSEVECDTPLATLLNIEVDTFAAPEVSPDNEKGLLHLHYLAKAPKTQTCTRDWTRKIK